MQRPVYDVRISDWISDVFSSDLRHWIEEIGSDKPGDAGPDQYPDPARGHACQQHERKPGGTENNSLAKIWLVHQQKADESSHPGGQRNDRQGQNGIAAGRERGCRYVALSGVVVPLKTKTE